LTPKLYWQYYFLAPPTWITKPDSQIASINGNISWLCETSGFPLPFVKWQKLIGL